MDSDDEPQSSQSESGGYEEVPAIQPEPVPPAVELGAGLNWDRRRSQPDCPDMRVTQVTWMAAWCGMPRRRQEAFASITAPSLQVYSDSCLHPRYCLPSGEVKPRRPMPVIRASELLSQLQRVGNSWILPGMGLEKGLHESW